MEKLIIPGKLKVGYQNRQDTYTQKLAYVIYYDPKGKLRKENSWLGWRDAKIQDDEFENVPTEGFIINRNVGGVRYSSWNWNNRREKVRIFDPRNFEFEITIENLLYILQECTSTKGKGLEGKFVYAWDGPELVLLPVDSEEYKKSTEFTGLQTMKVTKDMMVPGRLYTFKDGEVYMYLGRHDYFTWDWTEVPNPDKSRHQYRWGRTVKTTAEHTSKKLHHIFIPMKNGTTHDPNSSYYYKLESGFTKIASIVSEEISEEFADHMVAFKNSPYGTKVVDIVAKPAPFVYDPAKLRGVYGDSYKLHYQLDELFVSFEFNESSLYNGGNYTHKDPIEFERRYSGGYVYRITEDGIVQKVDFDNPEMNIKDRVYKYMGYTTETTGSGWNIRTNEKYSFGMAKFNQLSNDSYELMFKHESGAEYPVRN